MQGQRHEVAGRHARQLQARMGLKAKTPVVRGIAQQHATCGPHDPQFGQRLFHQARTDALPLPLRQDGNRPQPVPTLDLPSVVIGDRDGGQCDVTDDLPVFLGHDGER